MKAILLLVMLIFTYCNTKPVEFKLNIANENIQHIRIYQTNTSSNIAQTNALNQLKRNKYSKSIQVFKPIVSSSYLNNTKIDLVLIISHKKLATINKIINEIETTYFNRVYRAGHSWQSTLISDQHIGFKFNKNRWLALAFEKRDINFLKLSVNTKLAMVRRENERLAKLHINSTLHQNLNINNYHYIRQMGFQNLNEFNSIMFAGEYYKIVRQMIDAKLIILKRQS